MITCSLNIDNPRDLLSEKETQTGETTSLDTDFSDHLAIVLVAEHYFLVPVSKILHVSVDEVDGEALECIAEFVFVEILSKSGQSVVWPSCILDSVLVLVVLDLRETLLKELSIEQRVQSVAGMAQSTYVPWHYSSVLFLC